MSFCHLCTLAEYRIIGSQFFSSTSKLPNPVGGVSLASGIQCFRKNECKIIFLSEMACFFACLYDVVVVVFVRFLYFLCFEMLKFQEVVARYLPLFINLPATQYSSLTHRFRPVFSPVQFSLVMILIILMCPLGNIIGPFSIHLLSTEHLPCAKYCSIHWGSSRLLC